MELFVLLISDQEEDSGVVEDDDLSDLKNVEGDGECGAVLQVCSAEMNVRVFALRSQTCSSNVCFHLQFDYGAIADRLFQLASHTNIPSFNRSKIYKLVKMLV